MPSAPKKKSSAQSTATPRNNNEKDDGVESDDGIDQEGMERLMKALGEDGLDDYDRAHLIALHGTSDEEEDDDEAQEQDAESHSEEEESVDEVEDEDEAKSESEIDEEDVEEAGQSPAEKNTEEEEDVDDGVALDEVESVDEDVVPRQKVEINNTVSAPRPDEDAVLTNVHTGCTRADTPDDKIGSRNTLDRKADHDLPRNH